MLDGLEASAPSSRALLLGEIEELVDDEGRPVGEARASAALREGVPTELRVCPYPGSRFHHRQPMNQSALAQTTRHWPRILGVIAAVRAAWLETQGHDRVSVRGLAHLTQTVMLVPSFLAFRADPPLRDRLPAAFAAVHKIVSGIHLESINLVFDELRRGGDPERDAGADELFDYAERTGLLIGRPGGEVCAGPPAMIAATFRLLVKGASPEGADRDFLHSFLPDLGACLRYGAEGDALLFALYELAIELRRWALPAGREARAWDAGEGPGAGPAERLSSELDAFAARGLWSQRLRALRYGTGNRAGLEASDYPRVLAGLRALPRGPAPAGGPPHAPLRPQGDLPGPLRAALEELLRAEQRGLPALQEREARIHRALGRPAPARPLDPDRIAELLGPLPSQHLERAGIALSR